MTNEEIGIIVNEMIDAGGGEKTVTLHGIRCDLKLTRSNLALSTWDFSANALWAANGKVKRGFSVPSTDEVVFFVQSIWPEVQKACEVSSIVSQIRRMSPAIVSSFPNSGSYENLDMYSYIKAIHNGEFMDYGASYALHRMRHCLAQAKLLYLKTPEGDMEKIMSKRKGR